jgi:hypothetical protein
MSQTKIDMLRPQNGAATLPRVGYLFSKITKTRRVLALCRRWKLLRNDQRGKASWMTIKIFRRLYVDILGGASKLGFAGPTNIP